MDEETETSNLSLKNPWLVMKVRKKAISTHYQIVRVIYLIIKQFAIPQEPNIALDMGVRKESDAAQQKIEAQKLMGRTAM